MELMRAEQTDHPIMGDKASTYKIEVKRRQEHHSFNQSKSRGEEEWQRRLTCFAVDHLDECSDGGDRERWNGNGVDEEKHAHLLHD